MKKVAETHHLVQRETVWYYRRRVPKHLVKAFGASVIQFSLQTPHKKQAIKKREVYDVEWSAKFEAAEGKLKAKAEMAEGVPDIAARLLTEPLAIQLIQEYVERTDKRRQARRMADPISNSDELAEIKCDAEIALGVLENPDDPRGDEWVSSVGDELLRKADAAIGGASLSYAAFASLVERGLMELKRREICALNHDHGRPFFDDLFNPSRPPPVTVHELSEQFLVLKAEEGAAYKLSPKHLDKQRGNIALIREILGDATAVRDLNWDACRMFVSVLAQVPANRTKLFKGHSLDRAIILAKENGNPGLSAISQQQYLGTLKELLDLAVNKQLIQTNYASKLQPLKVDTLSPDEKTVSFDAEQLQQFFHSAYYQACASGKAAPYKNSSDKDWRFWLPLLCLFMGMRPREACQMYVDDLKKTEKGTWFIDILETDDDAEFKKTIKTQNSRRQIPLHPELIAAGFVAFVDDQRKASGDPRLFRDVKNNKYDDPVHYALRRFREKFLPDAINLKPRQTFYSFRHTWRDAMRLIEAPPDALKALGAWSQGSLTSDNYGKKCHPDHQAQFIDKIAYEGLDLTHLHMKQ